MTLVIQAIVDKFGAYDKTVGGWKDIRFVNNSSLQGGYDNMSNYSGNSVVSSTSSLTGPI